MRRTAITMGLAVCLAAVGGQVAQAQPPAGMPEDQANFMKIVELTQDRRELTDEKRKEVVAARMVLLCEQAPTGSVSDWLGTVWFSGTTSDGKRTLGIALTKNISVETWEQGSGGAMPAEETPIDPGSPLGKDVAALKAGDKVRFSGSFAPDDERCIYAHRSALSEQIAHPAYIMKFRHVQPTSDGPTIELRDKPPIAARGYPESATRPSAVWTMPQDQARFIAAVSSAQAAYRAAPNDMAAGGLRRQRRSDLCKTLATRTVNDWLGTASVISSTNDGRGVLKVEIARNAALGTWNASFPDIVDRTLVEPGSDLFRAAVTLKTGDKVVFSGTFFPDEEDCVREVSDTIAGALREPNFLFRFHSIRKQ